VAAVRCHCFGLDHTEIIDHRHSFAAPLGLKAVVLAVLAHSATLRAVTMANLVPNKAGDKVYTYMLMAIRD